MALRIDLNCDMGESFGAWKMGNDEEILPYVSSANIACGFHGGDPATMRECTCSNCTCTDRGAATDSRRLYSPPCSLYSPVHGVQANSLPALPARSCSNVGESVAERRDIIGNLLDGE